MRKAKVVFCFLLFVLVLCFSGCSEKPQSLVIKDLKNMGNISETANDKSVYTQNKSAKALRKISRSDMAVLYFDEENYSVSLYDYASKKLWNCLPDFYEGSTPAVMSVEVLYKNELYTFNSQTDSVLKNKASAQIKEDSVVVNYTFEGKTKDETVITFSVPVYFAVTDGVMTVSIDCKKIDTSALPKDTYIKAIHLLEYFGSCSEAQKGDYILIPDGSGAVIDIESKAQKFDEIALPVYSADFSVNSAENKAVALVGAFGMKKGDSAFAALVENGEALATITAQKALKDGMYNKVGVRFDLIKLQAEKEDTYASFPSYEGEIRITYKLVSSDRANYVGMASAIREALIRNGTLGLEDSLEESTSLPFVLSIVGSGKNGNEKAETLTTFKQAQEVIGLFRSKGISNISLRYVGMFDGEIGGKDFSRLKINSLLGNKKDLEELTAYTELHNIKVYPSFNLLSASKGELKSTALSIFGDDTEGEITDISNPLKLFKSTRNFSSYGSLEENTKNILSFMRDNSFNAFSIADAGRYLYSDFSSSSYADRQSVKNSVFTQFSSLSSSGSIMVENGNIYSVKYADYIVNLPSSSLASKRDYCKSVPFVQSILHGIVSYTTSPLNINGQSDTALLKAAEYGAVPHFEVYYKDFSDGDKVDNYNYTACASLAQKDYERLSNTFNSLQNEKITNHYLVKKGVYCTEYSSNKSVYVNYNNKDVKINGVTVESRSFLMVG